MFPFVEMMLQPVPACVLLCWNAPTCKWLSVGACRFDHHGVEAVQQRQAGGSGEGGVAAHVRELHETLAAKLAATVMWDNGVPADVSARGSSARAALEVQFVEAWGSTTDQIQRAQHMENTEWLGQAVRHKCIDRTVNAPVEQVVLVTQVHVVGRTVEKTAEILQLGTTRQVRMICRSEVGGRGD